MQNTSLISSSKLLAPDYCCQALATLTIIIGLLGLIGHWQNLHFLMSFTDAPALEIAVSSALSLLCLGISLFLIMQISHSKKFMLIRTGILLIPLLIGFYEMSLYIITANFNPWKALYQTLQPFSHMSFLTSLEIQLVSLAILAINFLDKHSPWRSYGSGLLGLFILETSAFSLLGHFINLPILFDFSQSIPSIIGLILLSLFLVRESGKREGLISPLFSSQRKIRNLGILGLLISLAVLGAGLDLEYLMKLLMTNSNSTTMQALLIAFEYGTILLSILVIALSLRVLFFFEKSLLTTEQLRHSEERFRLLVSAVQEYAIYMLDPSGHITTWNEGAERISGYTTQEIMGQPVSTLYTEAEIAKGEPELQLALTKEQGHLETEGFHKRKDGMEFRGRITMTALSNAAGKHIGYSRVVRDLTLQHQMEDSLKSSLNELINLKQAIDASSIVSMTDPSGKITYVNDAFCHISQYPRDALIGESHRKLDSNYHSQAFFKTLWDTILQQKIWKGEIRNRTSNGSLYWVDTTIYPFFNNGVPTQFIAIHHDITPLKKAEDDLRLNAHRQKVVSILSQHALSGIDIDKLMDQIVVLTANALTTDYCKILELLPARRELLLKAGYGWHEGTIGIATVHAEIGSQAGYTLLIDEPVIVEDFRKETRFSAPALLREHNVVSGMSVVIRGETSRKPYGVLGVHTSQVRRFDNEAVIFLQGVANILAMALERKHAETLLRQFNEELEKRVAERTQELEKAKKEAEEANRQKTRVLAFVSHDLKNPLSALGRFAAVLEQEAEGHLSEKQLTIVGYIIDGVRQMRALVTDILDKARLEQGQLSVALEVIALRAFLDALNPMITMMSEEKNVHVIVDIQPELKEMEADPRFLRQILLNLLSNATKYNKDDGQVILKMHLSDDEQFIVIKVIDTGCGIPSEKIPKLFTDYFRTGQTEQVEGTGLGLAFIKRLVEMQGGSLSVESELGVGSTFTVTLPSHISAPLLAGVQSAS
jgi:PAS domain S-box-containing protein